MVTLGRCSSFAGSLSITMCSIGCILIGYDGHVLSTTLIVRSLGPIFNSTMAICISVFACIGRAQ
jgi:hypothetical protein